MSQNKTIVPGVDYDNLENTNYDSGFTYNEISQAVPEEDAGRQIKMQERVVVGVLFSISRGLLGEIFPLYLGRNIIGQTTECDVSLREETVSSEHAILYIRKNGHPAHYEMTLTDYNSMYGTFVNGQDGRYETLPVQENDVITIGSHYKLLIKMFDVEQLGLQEEAEFEDCTSSSEFPANEQTNASISNDFYTPTSNKDNSSRTVIS